MNQEPEIENLFDELSQQYDHLDTDEMMQRIQAEALCRLAAVEEARFEQQRQAHENARQMFDEVTEQFEGMDGGSDSFKRDDDDPLE